MIEIAHLPLPGCDWVRSLIGLDHRTVRSGVMQACVDRLRWTGLPTAARDRTTREVSCRARSYRPHMTCTMHVRAAACLAACPCLKPLPPAVKTALLSMAMACAPCMPREPAEPSMAVEAVEAATQLAIP